MSNRAEPKFWMSLNFFQKKSSVYSRKFSISIFSATCLSSKSFQWQKLSNVKNQHYWYKRIHRTTVIDKSKTQLVIGWRTFQSYILLVAVPVHPFILMVARPVHPWIWWLEDQHNLIFWWLQDQHNPTVFAHGFRTNGTLYSDGCRTSTTVYSDGCRTSTSLNWWFQDQDNYIVW